MQPKSAGKQADAWERLRAIIKEKSYITDGDFKLASGTTSNFFFDMKPTLLDPEGANLAADLILERIKADRIKAIGGMELGACPIADAVCILSYQRGMPVNAFYVRKTPKKRGTQKMIEGTELKPGDRVVIVEDVATSGGSALQAAEEVRRFGCEIIKVITIIDREQGAEANLKAQDIALDRLFRKSDFE